MFKIDASFVRIVCYWRSMTLLVDASFCFHANLFVLVVVLVSVYTYWG